MPTHEVTNQPPPLADYDAYASDVALVSAVDAFGSVAGVRERLSQIGRFAGSAEAREWGFDADRHTPELRTHDRYGNRVDEVLFHPAWHQLMKYSVGAGLHGTPWTGDRAGRHVERAAGFMLVSQNEAGHGCPISMSYAIMPALRMDPELLAKFGPGLTSTTYDFGLRRPSDKAGLIAGMAMTEKQGGSDVRTNTTTATPEGDHYVLRGHKWFCSAPMSDLFLVLAQAPGGLTCFALPRVLEDSSRNPLHIQRLKDKLGNRSNASSEIEFDDTVAYRLGDEGRGVRTIVEMVSATRLDCVLGSTALMRKGLSEAIWHARHRSAFGNRLSDQPLMQAVLADLAIEVEAATWLGLRLAAAVDAIESGAANADEERALRRLALPMSKYYVCKRAPFVTFEAMECLGGVGYVEETGMPRLYREAPVNSIWEGSGNVNALDLLRALSREPETLEAWLNEVSTASGMDTRFDAALTGVLDELGNADPGVLEFRARWLAERMALLLQASLLLRHAPAEVADVFCATRLGGNGYGAGQGATLGVLPRGTDATALVERALSV